MLSVRLKQLPEAIRLSLLSDNVPLVLASPGLAKSAIVKSLADSFKVSEEENLKLKMIDIRAAQYNPTDFQGLIFRNGDKADFLPLGNLPIEGDEIPEGYDGWLLFLDEITHAPKAVQNALYKLVLDRMVGNSKLHDRVLIVAAGNLATDNAFVEPMSTALVSRFNLIRLNVTDSNKKQLLTDWSELWADGNINPNILAYLNYRPEDIYTFNPDSQDPYACLRTWEKVSHIMDLDEFSHSSSRDPEEFNNMQISRALIEGSVGSAVTRGLFDFLEVASKLVSFEDILKDPLGVDFKKTHQNQYAIMPVLVKGITMDNVDTVFQFIEKNMDIEFHIVIARMLIARNKAFLGSSLGQSVANRIFKSM